MTDLSSPIIMLPCSSCAVPKEEYQESILQQLMSEVELEFSALDQEINVARLLMGSTGSSDT